MQNYNFLKNNVFVAKICKYALYESSEGLFCAPRKAANFCHPGHDIRQVPDLSYCNTLLQCMDTVLLQPKYCNVLKLNCNF